MTKDELLAALAVERQDQTWWTTRPRPASEDDEVTCARRRRALEQDFDRAAQEVG